MQINSSHLINLLSTEEKLDLLYRNIKKIEELKRELSQIRLFNEGINRSIFNSSDIQTYGGTFLIKTEEGEIEAFIPPDWYIDCSNAIRFSQKKED